MPLLLLFTSHCQLVHMERVKTLVFRHPNKYSHIKFGRLVNLVHIDILKDFPCVQMLAVKNICVKINK